MTPEVSVVIPTRNRRAMVREAIESVLAQRGGAFELIVVDDGSTDATFAGLERIAVTVNRSCGGGAMRVARTAPRGPAAARNYGAAIARGEFIAFLDSDDLWMPGKLARQLVFMRGHRDCFISQTQEIWLRGGRRVNPARRHLKRAGDFFAASLQTCLVSPSAVIVRRDLFRALGGFDEAMAACEDYDLWLRILVAHQIGLLDEPLVVRRAGHHDQLSATIPALDRFRIVALMKLLGADGLTPARRVAVAQTLGRKCGIYANGLERRGRLEAARLCREIAARAVCWGEGRMLDELAPAITLMRALAAGHDAAAASGGDARGGLP